MNDFEREWRQLIEVLALLTERRRQQRRHRAPLADWQEQTFAALTSPAVLGELAARWQELAEAEDTQLVGQLLLAEVSGVAAMCWTMLDRVVDAGRNVVASAEGCASGAVVMESVRDVLGEHASPLVKGVLTAGKEVLQVAGA